MIEYFIRHGQTELNKQRIHQFDNTPLSKEGRLQAMKAAVTLMDKGIEGIISSPLHRAQETAHIIADALKLPYETTPLLAEMHRPSEWEGLSYDDPTTLAIKKQMKQNPEYRYKDGETFSDLHTRATTLLEMIKTRKEEKLVFVTHGRMLKMILTTMLYPTLTEESRRLYEFFEPNNGSITTTSFSKKDGWRLLI